MDLDAAQINALAAEEKAKLQKEGQCFTCYDFSTLFPFTVPISDYLPEAPFIFPIPLSHVTFPFTVTLLLVITCRRDSPSSLSRTLTHYAYLFISDTLYDTLTRCGRPFPGPLLYLTLASTMTKP